MIKKRAPRDPDRPPLTRQMVLKAAIRLADEGGVSALAMRRVAQEVGVEAMSLYNHVANKKDLLDGIVDIVVEEIDLPEVGGDWRACLRNRACSAHEVLLRHPWATMLIVSRINVGPAMLRYTNATIGCLVEAGFSYEAADRVWNALDSFVYGFTLQELNFPWDPDEFQAAAAEHLDKIPEPQYPYLHRLTRKVMDGEHEGVQSFEVGLDLLLDGFERLRQA